MESTTARKSKHIIIAAILLAIVGSIGGFLWAGKGLHKARLNMFVRSDLPMLDLQLQFIDINGNEIPAHLTKLGNEITEKVPDSCPEIKGGDVRNSAQIKAGDTLKPNCAKTITWYVKRHPVALSLYFADPQKVLSTIEKNPVFKEIWQSRLIQGIFHDPLQNASIRAEDLGLHGLEGTFISTFIKEAITAHGQLHYDAVHGKKGFVFSFIRNECPYASKALPIIIRVLTRSGYVVPKLKEPILEMRIGLQRVFITEYETRVFIANGLESLINVLESFPIPGKIPPNEPVVLAIRGEAFLDNLLPVIAGKPAFEIDLGFSLSNESQDSLNFPAGKFAKHLRPKLFKGVLAGIPHDAFAAAAASFSLPPDMSSEQWHRLAIDGPGDQPANGPEEGGVAFIWDLSSEGHENEITQMGVIIASQTTPDDVQRFKNLFADPTLTTDCGGGTVFLAATSGQLLTRMKEACERQSLSVLDWNRGSLTEAFASRQLFFFLNPGTGMRELFLAGGAKNTDQDGSEEPWKVQYEKAKTVMRADSEKVFTSLPIFTYSGNSMPDAETVQLQGIHVKQGAVQ